MGEEWSSPFKAYQLHIDLDGTGFYFRLLRNGDNQNAMFVIRLDVLDVNCIGQCKRSGETSEPAFLLMEGIAIILVRLSFAHDDQ